MRAQSITLLVLLTFVGGCSFFEAKIPNVARSPEIDPVLPQAWSLLTERAPGIDLLWVGSSNPRWVLDRHTTSGMVTRRWIGLTFVYREFGRCHMGRVDIFQDRDVDQSFAPLDVGPTLLNSKREPQGIVVPCRALESVTSGYYGPGGRVVGTARASL